MTCDLSYSTFIKNFYMSKVTAAYQTVAAYLIIPDAAGFIHFTQNVFKAELLNKHMRKNENIIMHGEIKIGQQHNYVC